MSNRVELFDTTLRDGTQGEHVNLSARDKLRIARRLDEFGIDGQERVRSTSSRAARCS